MDLSTIANCVGCYYRNHEKKGNEYRNGPGIFDEKFDELGHDVTFILLTNSTRAFSADSRGTDSPGTRRDNCRPSELLQVRSGGGSDWQNRKKIIINTHGASRRHTTVTTKADGDSLFLQRQSSWAASR